MLRPVIIILIIIIYNTSDARSILLMQGFLLGTTTALATDVRTFLGRLHVSSVDHEEVTHDV